MRSATNSFLVAASIDPRYNEQSLIVFRTKAYTLFVGGFHLSVCSMGLHEEEGQSPRGGLGICLIFLWALCQFATCAAALDGGEKEAYNLLRCVLDGLFFFF